jgi:DNA-nicking Smr family endonuclease
MSTGRSGKSGKSGKPGHTDDDDALLWKRVADTTKPLPGRAVKVPAAAAPPRKPEPKGAPRTSASAPKEPARPASPKPSELRAGEAQGLDRRTAERLRRGQIPIEARIDLHGQTQQEAHRALAAFITGAHKAGRRCVLVITGKGGPSGARRERDEGVMPDRERGILRRAVPRWLNEPDLRPLILGFAQAQPAHGGAGAVYVLLRRKR